MTHALLDILTGEYKEQDFHSIKTHLTRLLNSRQGSLNHMPDYGLPDVAEIYQGLPYSVNDLIKAIKTTIEKYEPRLKNIVVKPKAKQEKDCVLQLEISGTTTQDEVVQFDTYFMSGCTAEIENKFH
jgi:type VI secretion system protein